MVDDESLISAAIEARQHAYCPYSGFAVGAALVSRDGVVFRGCNVENLSFGLTVCAERSAVFNAITQGHRKFLRIAIVADTEVPISPCGACRQVLAEFSDLRVILATLTGRREIFSLGELLPRAKEGILDLP
ncbi:MAG: cytidine deaminase [Verrucomicrobiales bacterium]